MKSGHDEIREMLPEYLRGSLPESMRADVQSHLKVCQECREEHSLLSDLLTIEAPDPGDFFWATLPQKVRGAVRQERERTFSLKSLFLGAVPAAVATAALLLLVFTLVKKQELPEVDPTFNGPFTAELLDYGDLTEGDVTAITKHLAGDEEDLPLVVFVEDPYNREFALLSAEECDSIDEELKRQQKQGG